ncbi:type II toxin-antitoxin system RelE/ParE family toxin [Novosphingobium sp.]|uniref:type II toxin-antitoxin system RelE/ParE family toxin n=1 Tax=Novosphingobium sp. TaxID=1874826 RepID=UPI003BA87CB1
MPSFRITVAARYDLADIDDYSVERFGEEAAEAYARGLTEAFLFLTRYPLSGRLRPELPADTRCKTYRSHLIFYRFTDDTVFIQRILHHSQDAAAHLRP